MKLRNKIMLGTLCCVLLAISISCALMIAVNKNNMVGSAQSYTKSELIRLIDRIQENRSEIEESKTELTTDAMMKYFVSKQMKYSDEDTIYVLQSGEKMIFNNSGFNVASILALETADVKNDIIQNDKCSYLLTGRNLVIGGYDYQVCVVRDVTELFEQIHHLIMVCVAIGMAISFTAVIGLLLFLKYALKPLEQLKREADAISQGEFQKRIEVKGKDELASLSHSFNTMAESIQQHILEVEETSEARNRMIHALAHEMRTPVTAISGYAYAIRSMKMNDEQKEEALEFIDLEARRLERLSGKLTGLVGLDTCDFVMRKIDLSDLKKQLQMILKDRKEISLQISDGYMMGDPDLLIMMITNLCDNAKKAHANNIEVCVTTEGIWVKDNGTGISKEAQMHIFEAFYQGDTSRNQEGFGLGLTLCQEIARLHQTVLQVESEPGKGSTFYLYNSFTTS